MMFDFVKTAGEKMMSFFSGDASNDDKATKITEFVSKLDLGVSNFSVNVNDDVAAVSGEAQSTESKEKTIVAVGNVEGIAKVEDKITVANGGADSKFYTVKSGDSLSKISKEFYGDPMKYSAIFEANKPMLDHPDKIYPGQTLRIPA